MLISVLDSCLYFLAGICFFMSPQHLFNFTETQRHYLIAKSRSPKVASTIWGIIQLAAGLLILLALHYQFDRNLGTLFIFLGFSCWAIFVRYIATTVDKQTSHSS
jgi:hypothetical protein